MLYGLSSSGTATMYGNNYENPLGDPPKTEIAGAIFTVVERQHLQPPADPRSSVAILTCSDPMYGAFLIWNDQYGFMNRPQSNILDARWELEKSFVSAQRASERRILDERYAAERARVDAMAYEEILTEGRAHIRYGKEWRALRAPLLLRNGEDVRACIHWDSYKILSRDVLAWLDDQGIVATPHELPLICVSLRPGLFRTIYCRLIDFGSDEEAVFYKLRWF